MSSRSLLKLCMKSLEAAVLLAHEVGHRHPAVVEAQVRGVGAPPAHLLERRAREARRVALDHERRDAAGALLGSVRTAVVMKSARTPEVMKVFSPFTM